MKINYIKNRKRNKEKKIKNKKSGIYNKKYRLKNCFSNVEHI